MKYIYETQDFLKKAYENGGYFCTRYCIFQVNYSQAQKQYTFQKIYTKPKNEKIGFSKRGYCNFLDGETVERWTGLAVI